MGRDGRCAAGSHRQEGTAGKAEGTAGKAEGNSRQGWKASIKQQCSKRGCGMVLSWVCFLGEKGGLRQGWRRPARVQEGQRPCPAHRGEARAARRSRRGTKGGREGQTGRGLRSKLISSVHVRRGGEAGEKRIRQASNLAQTGNRSGTNRGGRHKSGTGRRSRRESGDRDKRRAVAGREGRQEQGWASTCASITSASGCACACLVSRKKGGCGGVPGRALGRAGCVRWCLRGMDGWGSAGRGYSSGGGGPGAGGGLAAGRARMGGIGLQGFMERRRAGSLGELRGELFGCISKSRQQCRSKLWGGGAAADGGGQATANNGGCAAGGAAGGAARRNKQPSCPRRQPPLQGER